MRSAILLAMMWLVTTTAATSCTPTEPNELDTLGTVSFSIKDQPFLLWIADAPDERERGLMFVTSDQVVDLPDGTRRGMIFVFPSERGRSFWMKNTIIPLDIAYLDSKGTVVATHTMPPLDDRSGQYTSGSPARYAIEVNEDVWNEIGLRVGDTIAVPESLLDGVR